MTKNYDVIIIGAGPSGHSAAVRISQLGGRVAIIERDFVGGICTNWGCTPSKAMIESAKVAQEVKDSEKYGIKVQNYHIDFPSVANRRDQVVLNTRHSIEHLLKSHHVDIFQGEAVIDDPKTIIVKFGKLDPDGFTMHYSGEEETLKTKNIIIATGSRPLIPSFLDKNDPTMVSSNRLITIRELPETLTIVGGGVIGMEFATIFSNLGSKVTVVELLDRVLAGFDLEISAEITQILEDKGVKILTGHKVLSIKDGVLAVQNQATQELIELESELNLIAIGREAVLNIEMWQKCGLKFDRHGIDVNDYLQTNIPGIWSIGDATGKSILAHVGIQQGIICAENIMSTPENYRKMDYSVIPAVIYSIPEIVSVGIVPDPAPDIQIIKVPFDVNLRANIEYHSQGFIKLWIRDKKILAAQTIGHNVSEIMQEVTNMIALATNIEDVSEIIHAHPSYGEIIRSSLDYALNKAVDFTL